MTVTVLEGDCPDVLAAMDAPGTPESIARAEAIRELLEAVERAVRILGRRSCRRFLLEIWSVLT